MLTADAQPSILEAAALDILFDLLSNAENFLLLFLVSKLCSGDFGEDCRQIRVLGILFQGLELLDTSLELDLLDNTPESAPGAERLDLGQQVVVGSVLAVSLVEDDRVISALSDKVLKVLASEG
ncbi:hypothetical protein HG530_003532 [Fusarium avenaceum]|nr:hypothetical protein HG530_003532 [Fusarium avenaceum]